VISAPLTVGIALVAIIIDRNIINKASSSAFAPDRSSRFGVTLLHAALVPALLAGGAAITGFLSQFVLRRFNLEYLDVSVFILVILGITLGVEAVLSRRGKPGSLNRMLSGAAAMAVLLGLASFLSTGSSGMAGAGGVLWVGTAWFVLFPAYCGVKAKMGLGIKAQGVVPSFSREMVIAGLLALVAVGVIASLHY
jgi:hypothetical protein